MSFNFTCSHCKATLQAEDDWAGRETVCPVCQKKVTILHDPLSDDILPLRQPPPREAASEATSQATEKAAEAGKKTGMLYGEAQPRSFPLDRGERKYFGARLFIFLPLVLVGGLACVMVGLGIRWYLNRPHFLMEEIVGVSMGQKVTTATPNEEDYFHYFKIDPRYRGKIRFEYAKMSDYDKKEYASDYMTDYCVVSTPCCFTGTIFGSGRVLILQTEILDDDLAKTLIRDFDSKGFSKGTFEIFGKGKTAIELSSLATKMTNDGDYEFISSDKKYMLTIKRSREPGMFEYDTWGNDIPLVTTFCLYLACNDPEKGVMPILLNHLPKRLSRWMRNKGVNPFFLCLHPSWPGKAFLGSHLPFAQNALRGIHAIIHIREGGAGCVHIDGFQKH